MHKLKLSIFIITLVAFSGCSDPEQTAFIEKKKTDSVESVIAQEKSVPKKADKFSDDKGFVGVFEVPEMLTLCIKDSASAKDMAKKYAEAFTSLEQDLQYLNLKSSGAAGAINYNNDPSNFIFECVYPIEKMPSKQPKKCQVVVLEPSNMLIYNYYGPYAYLYSAYEEIRKQMKLSKLEQNGPMREFYITDPSRVTDSTKWLTRIMVPVMSQKQLEVK